MKYIAMKYATIINKSYDLQVNPILNLNLKQSFYNKDQSGI